MKNHPSYLVLLCALLFSGMLNAKVTHYVGAYANAGEWSLLPSKSAYKPSLGANGGLGFAYEMQYGTPYSVTRLLFDAGLGVQMGGTRYSIGGTVNDTLFNQSSLLNANGKRDQFDYVYSMQGRQDQYTSFAAEIPLMIGMQHERFYFLAGVKMHYHFLTKISTATELSTYAHNYDFDDYHNMPEYQFFEGIQKNLTGNTKWDIDVDVCLEVGGRLGEVTSATGFDVPKRKVEYRLAGYVDYGLTNINKITTNPLLVKPDKYDSDKNSADYVYNPDGTNMSMVDNLKLNDIMSTSGFAQSVKSLTIGIKFTILFQLPEAGQCVICRDAYRLSNPRFRGGMQYEE